MDNLILVSEGQPGIPTLYTAAAACSVGHGSPTSWATSVKKVIFICREWQN